MPAKVRHKFGISVREELIAGEIAAIEKVEAARMHIANYINEDLDLTPLGEALDLLDAALEVLTEGY